MKLPLLLMCLLLSTISVVNAQYAKTSANSNGIGWRKVAYIDSNNKRGFGKVTIYIPGGDNEPLYADIYWYSNWTDVYVLRTETLVPHWPYWEAFRITEDNDRAYIEVQFTSPVTQLNIISDDYGYAPAKPYSGNLLAGSGTERHKVRNGRFNIANQFIINNNGNVGIGTVGLTTAKLAVNGDIRAKEIKVETTNFWPDYVFEDDYHLLSLDSLELYIKERGHLPEIPSASTISNDGVPVGDMINKLLKKVEELSLHLIQKEKEIKQLNEVIGQFSEVNNRLDRLEKAEELARSQ